MKKRKNGQSEFSRFAYQLSKNKMAMIGLVILIIEIFIAIFANQIAPYGYQEIDPMALRQGPSSAHFSGQMRLEGIYSHESSLVHVIRFQWV